MASRDGQSKWFAVRVRTRSEAAVGFALEQKLYAVFVPTYLEVRQYSDRVKKVQSALFPGYLFCQLDPERTLPLLITPGVQSIVCNDEKPTPIEEGEIEAVRKVVDSGFTARPWPFLKVGQRVRIVHGSLSGAEGYLIKEKGVDRLVLSISLLQRAISVEIDRTWVQPLSA